MRRRRRRPEEVSFVLLAVEGEFPDVEGDGERTKHQKLPDEQTIDPLLRHRGDELYKTCSIWAANCEVHEASMDRPINSAIYCICLYNSTVVSMSARRRGRISHTREGKFTFTYLY